MAASWKDAMREASYKGVAFHVSAVEKEAGRRTVVHEFIQRENPYVEDLGAAASRFTITGFLLGPGYREQRDALERALSEAEPGTLVHPHYGEIPVAQTAPYRARESSAEGGMCIVTMSFARVDESGPSASVSSKAAALSRADVFGSLSCSAFDGVFSLDGQPSYVVAQSFNAVASALGSLAGYLSTDAGGILAALGIADGYGLARAASAGRSLWSAVAGVVSASGKSGEPLGTALLTSAAAMPGDAAPAGAGSMRQAVAANTNAVNELFAELSLAEGAKAYAEALPQTSGEARDMRYALVDGIDAVADAGRLAKGLYAPLLALRAGALAAIAENAGAAPDIITVDTAAELPALALVYRHTAGITALDDFLARNAVAHPGFVPSGTLEVLLDG